MRPLGLPFWPRSKRKPISARYRSVLLRTVCVVFVLLLPVMAGAAPTPGPAHAAEAGARDGGVIAGRIVAVDYQRSTLGVDGGGRARLLVTLLPSTSIQGRDAGYHTITDLKVGDRVQIFSSIVGDQVVAQIIRILP
jgi:hypothetical protein